MTPRLVVYFATSDLFWINGRLWLYPYLRDVACWWTYERMLEKTAVEYARR